MININSIKPPKMTAIVELNGIKAYKAAGQPIRKYPRFLPVPDTVLSYNPLLEIGEFQHKLSIHAELVMVIGKDLNVGETEKIKDAILGYSIGIGIFDDSMVATCKTPTPRDIQINTWYGFYMDKSRIQNEQLITYDEFEKISNPLLTLSVGKLERQRYELSEMLFQGDSILEGMLRIIPFHKGDVICLGPVDAPIVVPPDYRFEIEDQIIVDGGNLGNLNIRIVDSRKSI